jgi:hypothetical protein
MTKHLNSLLGGISLALVVLRATFLLGSGLRLLLRLSFSFSFRLFFDDLLWPTPRLRSGFGLSIIFSFLHTLLRLLLSLVGLSSFLLNFLRTLLRLLLFLVGLSSFFLDFLRTLLGLLVFLV